MAINMKNLLIKTSIVANVLAFTVVAHFATAGLSGGISIPIHFKIDTATYSPNGNAPTTTALHVNSLESTGIGVGTSTKWTLGIGTSTAFYTEGISIFSAYGTSTFATPQNSLFSFRILDAASSTQFQVDTQNDRIGIGTSSPFAKVSIHQKTEDTANVNLFAIASSTASATTTHFIVKNTGFVGISTSTPDQEFSVTGDAYFSSSGTTTIEVKSTGINIGSCIELKSSTTTDPWRIYIGTSGALVTEAGSCQ